VFPFLFIINRLKPRTNNMLLVRELILLPLSKWDFRFPEMLAAYAGSWLSTFRDNLPVPSSKVCSILEMGPIGCPRRAKVSCSNCCHTKKLSLFPTSCNCVFLILYLLQLTATLCVQYGVKRWQIQWTSSRYASTKWIHYIIPIKHIIFILLNIATCSGPHCRLSSGFVYMIYKT
jgi:hypothetical protein